MELTRELKIETLEGGAIIELLNYELGEVLKDCNDINKRPDSVREISCKIKFKPDETRTVVLIGIDVGSKLGKRHPIFAKAFIEQDGTGLEPTAKEVELPLGQTSDDEEKPSKITVIGGKNQQGESNG